MVDVWGSDTEPSRPSPLHSTPLVDLGASGFVFTQKGLAHAVTAADLEGWLSPTFSPVVMDQS